MESILKREKYALKYFSLNISKYAEICEKHKLELCKIWEKWK